MNVLSKLFPPLKPEKFAQMVARELRKAGAPEPITIHPGEFSITVGGEKGLRLFLHNVYGDYCAAPVSKRKAVLAPILQMGAAGTPDAPETFAAASPNLLPRVRSRFLYEFLKLQEEAGGDKWPEMPHQVLTELLAVELAVDCEDQILSVSTDTLKGWNVTFEDALAKAKDNLWKRSNTSFVSPMSGLYVSPWQDNYDTARLYLHDLVWQLEVKGRHVAIAPNRDALIVCGDEDEAALRKMAELAVEALTAPWPGVGYAVRLDGSRWTSYIPPEGHPAYWLFKKLHIKTQVDDYQEQRALLEKISQKKGQDVYHASVSLAERTDGKEDCFCYCTWVLGLPSTLPKSDRIAFVEPLEGGKSNMLGLADWDKVQAAIGDLMAPMGMHPERWSITGIPTQEQLEAVEIEPL